MNKKKEEDNNKLSVEDYVTVAFAEDLDLAGHYKQLLVDNDIPAVVRRLTSSKSAPFSDIAVMVPEEYLDEAYAVIASEIDYEDFFDLAFRDDRLDDEEDLSENIL